MTQKTMRVTIVLRVDVEPGYSDVQTLDDVMRAVKAAGYDVELVKCPGLMIAPDDGGGPGE